jgi:hypothetical protein
MAMRRSGATVEAASSSTGYGSGRIESFCALDRV